MADLRRSLRIARGRTGPLNLVPLDLAATEFLADHQAPLLLVAHLRLVADVAGKLLTAVVGEWPEMVVDEEAVRFGAAHHDIGKVVHPVELQKPGHAHERAGERLLLAWGVEPRLARFCRTHAAWDAADASIEDLLVALADAVWKGQRWRELEDAVTAHIAAAAGRERWEVFDRLDTIITEIAAPADERLAWQTAAGD